MSPTTAASGIGDLARQLQSARNTQLIKSRLDRLTAEMSTGRSSDLVPKLGGQVTRLGSIDKSLAATQSYARSNTETAQRLSMMQLALDRLDSSRTGLATTLVTISADTPILQQQAASQAGLDALSDMITALNRRSGGQALFAGRQTDQTPLIDAESMLDSLRTALTAASTVAEVLDIMEDWFETPGGGFEGTAYLGDVGGPLRRRLDQTSEVSIDVRADDSGLRRILKSAALAALAHDPALSLDATSRSTLLRQAGVDLFTEGDHLTHMRGRLGMMEERVELTQTRLAAQETGLSLIRNALVSVDPFETASELQAVKLQLETHFATISRTAGLSLVSFLR